MGFYQDLIRLNFTQCSKLDTGGICCLQGFQTAGNKKRKAGKEITSMTACPVPAKTMAFRPHKGSKSGTRKLKQVKARKPASCYLPPLRELRPAWLELRQPRLSVIEVTLATVQMCGTETGQWWSVLQVECALGWIPRPEKRGDPHQ